MPFINVAGLPDAVKNVLPLLAQKVFLSAFNSTHKKTKSDEVSMQAGWGAVKNAGFKKGADGDWKKYENDEPLEYGSIKDMEIFQAGTHTTSTGEVVTTTIKQLKSIADFTSNLIKKGLYHPPIKLGHVKDKGLPALGWVEKLSIVGDKLVAFVTDVPKKLIKALKGKSWRERSVEIYPNYDGKGNQALKAIALLGADTPSVKGLSEILAQYSVEETEEVWEFNSDEYVSWRETDESHIIRLLPPGDFKSATFKSTDFNGKLPEGILATRGRLTADNEWATQRVIFNKEKFTIEQAKTYMKEHKFEDWEEVVRLQEEVVDLQTQLKESKLEKDKENKEEVTEMTEQELKDREERLKKEKAEFEEKEKERKKKEDEQTKKEKNFNEKQEQEATAKFEADVNALIKEFKEKGKVLPSQEDEIRTLARAYGENKIIKFGERGKEVDKPVLDVLRSMLEKNVKQIDFDETAKEGEGEKDKDTSKYAEFEKKIKEWRKENKDATYAMAVMAVGAENPKLYNEYQEEMIELGDVSGKDHDTPAIKK